MQRKQDIAAWWIDLNCIVFILSFMCVSQINTLFRHHKESSKSSVIVHRSQVEWIFYCIHANRQSRCKSSSKRCVKVNCEVAFQQLKSSYNSPYDDLRQLFQLCEQNILYCKISHFTFKYSWHVVYPNLTWNLIWQVCEQTQ